MVRPGQRRRASGARRLVIAAWLGALLSACGAGTGAPAPAIDGAADIASAADGGGGRGFGDAGGESASADRGAGVTDTAGDRAVAADGGDAAFDGRSPADSAPPRPDAAPDLGGSTSDAAPPTPTLAVRFADSVMARWPDPRNITGVTRGWDYNNGIVLRGMAEVYEKTRDPRYLAYIKQYVDSFVDGTGTIFVDAARSKRLQDQTFSLDLIQPAGLLLLLAQEVPGDARYRTAATAAHDLFATFPTNGEGGFWHKQTYPNEMWLDGIYMAEPFLARYGAANPSCGAACFDTPVAQATLLASHVRLSSGLLLHGWDWDHNATWCTGACAGSGGTGLSPEVWSRALGWYAMALVDLLEVLPAAHPGRASLLSLLGGLATGAKNSQDPSTGLWCQVVDKCASAGNWTESSGSAMLVYALKIGADRGYIDASFLAVAARAFTGLKANKVGSDATGPTIIDAADGMSIQSTFAAYVAIARRTNSYHGLCAIQLAAAAMEY